MLRTKQRKSKLTEIRKSHKGDISRVGIFGGESGTIAVNALLESENIVQDLLYTLLSVKHQLLPPLSLTTIILGSTRRQRLEIISGGVVYDVPHIWQRRSKGQVIVPPSQSRRQVEAIETTFRAITIDYRLAPICHLRREPIDNAHTAAFRTENLQGRKNERKRAASCMVDCPTNRSIVEEWGGLWTECYKRWSACLGKPGVELVQWQPALLPFLGNVSDRVALARILIVVSAHSDLPYMESLAMDLATFLASITCPVHFLCLLIFFHLLIGRNVS
ncbi:hypothetical protein WUBG_06944 [Wuchereria bancrofti]|uniref:Uncharacterized protein n=1 Tax=Wuchereria bancrofti TaxID=6293 RepID=J9B560_WUCBA|nr:hypothetical protein WUBG_06944 [Wuchereria bancrofti]